MNDKETYFSTREHIKTVDISHELSKKDAEIVSEIVYDKLTDLIDDDTDIPTFSYTLTVHYKEVK